MLSCQQGSITHALTRAISVAYFALAVILVASRTGPQAAAAEIESFDSLHLTYSQQVRPLLAQYCLECHSTDTKEGELDLERFSDLEAVRNDPAVWQRVAEMLDSGEMPPKDALQPDPDRRGQLREWVRVYLRTEAFAQAGDPGPVVLRRLNNAELTFTLRDLTGLNQLQPAREFPIDGAAGEGFTNTGHALVMSPALLSKYLDAAKQVAAHAVLLPDGLRFSAHTTRRDWTEEILQEIRTFYRRHSEPMESSQIKLQGLVWESADGGRLPLRRYLAATIEHRETLLSGSKSVETVAHECNLSSKYLGRLWQAINSPNPSLILDGMRARWRVAGPADVDAIASSIVEFQHALWKFSPVGHIGKLGGPKAWQEPTDPLVNQTELRVKLPDAPASEQQVSVYLVAGDAGDGNAQDFVIWHQPRLVAPGQPDLLLRDARGAINALTHLRQRLFASAAACLAAADEIREARTVNDLASLSRKHDVDADLLAVWLEYLGLRTDQPARIETHMTSRIEKSAEFDFVQGWGSGDTPNLVANSSDQHVRIPGNMLPHSVAVHPSPTLRTAVAWRSPAAMTVQVAGIVQHAHPECGNGVAWYLELRRGSTRQQLLTGTAQGPAELALGPIEPMQVQTGDLVSLLVGPRDGNHACDLTRIDLTLTEMVPNGREWSLSGDVSGDVLTGNPHADRHGNADIWHFYTESDRDQIANAAQIPRDSLLSKWQAASSLSQRASLAESLRRRLMSPPDDSDNSPDAALYRQLAALRGPLLTAARRVLPAKVILARPAGDDAPWGLDLDRFGRHPSGAAIDSSSLCVQAPSVIEVQLPAELADGAELVVTATLDSQSAAAGSVQVFASNSKPAPPATVQAGLPIIVLEGGPADQRIRSSLAEFRDLFPAALCYTRIVPVDEVVTLTLYHREDEQLRRLVLDEQETARLDQLWDELHYVSQDALTLVDAYEQLWQYATQDADPKVFEPLRQPIQDRAAAFRQRLSDTEANHVNAVLGFAQQAYRRPLSDVESRDLRALYRTLRVQELDHDEAVRLLLARVLVSPAFLYRTEHGLPQNERHQKVSDVGEKLPAYPVSDWELAVRLSYFLWSTAPDTELRQLAASGELSVRESLVAQTHRMLRDHRIRRLASEFACQWLQIYEFDAHDEKSELTFPTFALLRGAMYEESIRFISDLIQRDGSVLELLDADHTFLNGDLAMHYGIPDVTGPQWRRVDGVKQYGRGGILGMASILSKQSGASRTSPILRGNWLCEVLLGERLPKPPPGVPQLPDVVPAGLTERQLIEQHSSVAACAKCHTRIDPYGFSLERFDAIGRARGTSPGEIEIDTRTTLQDGTAIDGLDGLRTYLLTRRRDDFTRQFCRKLLGYALGRAVQLSDEPLLDEMQAGLKANNYRVSVVFEAIVRSKQFTHVRAAEALAASGGEAGHDAQP
jgi:hypothetical protein